MKMDNIASPWRYDLITDCALQPTNLRWPAIFRYEPDHDGELLCEPGGVDLSELTYYVG